MSLSLCYFIQLSSRKHSSTILFFRSLTECLSAFLPFSFLVLHHLHGCMFAQIKGSLSWHYAILALAMTSALMNSFFACTWAICSQILSDQTQESSLPHPLEVSPSSQGRTTPDRTSPQQLEVKNFKSVRSYNKYTLKLTHEITSNTQTKF